MNRHVLTAALFLSALLVKAQDQPEMAERMRSEGKIYVVIAVIALIFAAIVVFLAYIERRVRKMEKKLGDKNLK